MIILMACLTTAIGLSSVAGNYFEEASEGKLKYKPVVITVIAVSFAMSNFGLSTIISVAAPILGILYPPLIVLVVMAFFDRKITNDRIAGCAAYFALFASIIETVGLPGTLGSIVAAMPLAEYGLGWILPAVVGGVVGAFIPAKKPEFNVAEGAVFTEAEAE